MFWRKRFVYGDCGEDGDEALTASLDNATELPSHVGRRNDELRANIERLRLGLRDGDASADTRETSLRDAEEFSYRKMQISRHVPCEHDAFDAMDN